MRPVTPGPVAPGSHAGRTPRLLALCAALLLLAGGLTVVGAAAPAAEATTASAAGASAAPRLARLSTTVAARTQVLTLTGRGFGERRGTSAVSFGSRRARTYLSWSDTRIVCRVPTRARIGRLRVRVVTAQGVSEARLLRVRRALRIGTPRPLRPEGTIESARPQLRWRAAANAGSYEVRVAFNGVTVYAQAGIEGRSWRPPERIPYGATVSWKVRARRAGRAGAWSEAMRFRLRAPVDLDDSYQATISELVLFAGGFVPASFDGVAEDVFHAADGASLSAHKYNAFFALYTLYKLPVAFFSLPVARDWPSGAKPSADSPSGLWLVATGNGNRWPDGIPYNALPGQVTFNSAAGRSTAGGDYLRNVFSRYVQLSFGGDVCTGSAAWDVPGDWDGYPEWLVGELRLFKQAAALPDAFIPADGRLLSVRDYGTLYSVIATAYGGDGWTTFRVPSVTAPDGYFWAIAAGGVYPSR